MLLTIINYCVQLTLIIYIPSNPLLFYHHHPKPPRNILPTILTIYGPGIGNIIQDTANTSLTALNGLIELSFFASQNYKAVLKQLQSLSIDQAFADAPPPKVLSLKLPDISSSEESLPRGTSRTLVQLRSAMVTS